MYPHKHINLVFSCFDTRSLETLSQVYYCFETIVKEEKYTSKLKFKKSKNLETYSSKKDN